MGGREAREQGSMSHRFRNNQPRDLAQEDESPLAGVNWRFIKNFYGSERPQLLWLSVPDGGQRAEEDRITLPNLSNIKQRHSWNSRPGPGEPLLGCKVFWEAFRRAKLSIIFDRHLDPRLLKWLREEVQPGRLLGLQTLIIFAGKDKKTECTPLIKEIEQSLAKTRVKFHYVSEMTSVSAPFPHDRFALTDGEFWHFGGSNAGLEQCLTAVSRGWRADTMGIQEFIESAWAEMEKQRVIT